MERDWEYITNVYKCVTPDCDGKVDYAIEKTERYCCASCSVSIYYQKSLVRLLDPKVVSMQLKEMDNALRLAEECYQMISDRVEAGNDTQTI